MMSTFLKKCTVVFYAIAGVCLCPAIIFSWQGDPLSEPETRQLLEKMKDKEKTIQTFTAKIRQSKKTQMFQEPLQSEGLIYFDHAGRLLFKMTEPSPMIILFKEGRIFIQYPDIGKTEETYIGNDFLTSYMGFQASIEHLYEQYSIAIYSNPQFNRYRLTMTPKEPRMAKRIDMIEVMVKAIDLLPEQIQILEKDGDITSITLEFISINQSLPLNIFDIDQSLQRPRDR